MIKKFKLALAVVSLFTSAALNAATFQNITNWIGDGTNQAGFEIDWNNGTTNDPFLWGYRWNGDATGEQMLDALAAGDPGLYAEVSADTEFGAALFGLGLNRSGNQPFQLNPSLTFGADHLAVTDYDGVDDSRTNVVAGDLWQEGWFTAGYWAYYTSDESRLSEDFTDWDYASVGMTERILENDDWDGWVFAWNFNSTVPSDPFPGVGVVDTTPHPTLRLVHAFNGNDGNLPAGTLVLQGGILYGTASGGTNGSGVIFAVQTNGNEFTDLYTFAGSDGGYPLGSLIFSGGTLYGTTSGGGINSEGTVFSVGLDGSSFDSIYSFSETTNLINLDGATPECGLTLGDNNILFGSGNSGGQFASGALFRLALTGNDFTNLYSFSDLDLNGYNPDGYEPNIEMTAANGVLYGVAPYGGAQGLGTLFKMNEDGSEFTVLHEFSALDSSTAISTNADGAQPFGALLLTNGVLYGTVFEGGDFGSGCIFSMGTDGSNFTNLYSFSPVGGTSANNDGASPVGNLVLDGNILYGVTQFGGAHGQGTIYQINTNGSAFLSLAQFPRLTQYTNTVGSGPSAGLVKAGDSLYGTTVSAGPDSSGTVFALDLPNPALSAVPGNNQLSITWPVWAQKYVLEVSTNLVNWQPVASSVSGTNFIFNATMQGENGFFRLRK